MNLGDEPCIGTYVASHSKTLSLSEILSLFSMIEFMKSDTSVSLKVTTVHHVSVLTEP